MFRSSFILILLLLGLNFKALAQSNVSNYISDPALGQRCKELLKEREKKLTLKQKARALIKRNQDIRRKLDKKKTTALLKIRHNYNKLLQEERLLILKIQNLEETIVRTGCPGVSL